MSRPSRPGSDAHTIAALGLDPGATAGAALVAVPRGEDPRPRCLGALSITASRPSRLRGPPATAEWERRWYERALLALHRLRAPVPERRWLEVALVIEVPSFEGQGDAYAFGLARETERLSLACQAVWGRRPEPFGHCDWTAVHSELPIAKVGNGRHRIDEAGARVAGAELLLEQVPTSQRVDVAEAVLIAAAAVLVSLEIPR